MDKPIIVAKTPVMLNLEAGEYYWCACGKSSNQPFCDGSHQGTTISPVAFIIDSKQDTFLCQCKHSANKPYCDGSHANL